MLELIIEPESAREWHEVELELYRRGWSWSIGPSAEKALESGFSHNMLESDFDRRQIFVHSDWTGEPSKLNHGLWKDREDADAPIVSGENFLRHTDQLL